MDEGEEKGDGETGTGVDRMERARARRAQAQIYLNPLVAIRRVAGAGKGTSEACGSARLRGRTGGECVCVDECAQARRPRQLGQAGKGQSPASPHQSEQLLNSLLPPLCKR